MPLFSATYSLSLHSMNYPLSAVPSSSSYTTPTSPASASSTTTITATPTSSSAPFSTSLSPAAAAGIGSTFAGILILAAATIFYLHHRRRWKASAGTRLADGGAHGEPGMLNEIDVAPPSYPT